MTETPRTLLEAARYFADRAVCEQYMEDEPMSKNDTKPKRHSYSIRPDLVEAIQAEVKRRHAHADTRYNPATGKAWTLSDLVTAALEHAFDNRTRKQSEPSRNPE